MRETMSLVKLSKAIIVNISNSIVRPLFLYLQAPRQTLIMEQTTAQMSQITNQIKMIFGYMTSIKQNAQ